MNLTDEDLRSIATRDHARDFTALTHPEPLHVELARQLLACRHDLAACADKLAVASSHLGLVAQRAAVWITDWSSIEDDGWYIVVRIGENGNANNVQTLTQGRHIRRHYAQSRNAAIRIDLRIRAENNLCG